MPTVPVYLNNSDYKNYLGLCDTVLKKKTNPAKYIFLKAQNDLMKEHLKGKGFNLVVGFKVINDD